MHPKTPGPQCSIQKCAGRPLAIGPCNVDNGGQSVLGVAKLMQKLCNNFKRFAGFFKLKQGFQDVCVHTQPICSRTRI